MRYKVVKGKKNQLPPVGSVGNGRKERGYIAFYPDNEKDLPCPKSEFGHYIMDPDDMELIK